MQISDEVAEKLLNLLLDTVEAQQNELDELAMMVRDAEAETPKRNGKEAGNAFRSGE